METPIKNSKFENITQRAVYPFMTSLVNFTPLVPAGSSEHQQSDLEASARKFREFLQALYACLYQSPEQFGLPVTEDICIVGDEKDPKQFKQVVKRKLDKPRKLIERGMDFLMNAGRQGILGEVGLLLEKESYAGLLKENKIKKIFLSGLARTGLKATEAGGYMSFTSDSYPDMMLALKTLALACSRYEDSRLGKFNFARADFRALDGQFYPAPLDLYAIFDPIDYERLSRLDQFFTEQHYKPQIAIHAVHGWEVQYQGPSKIKTSPLLRIHYDPRHQIPLRVDIKCASTSRIIPFVYKQPRFLQEDFSRRVYTCRGDACGWCKDRKGLGPVDFEFDGVTRTICWYHNPDIAELDEDSLRLVQQYTLMHAELAQAS